jgi:ABC-2 type transport system ATP-binding protein
MGESCRTPVAQFQDVRKEYRTGWLRRRVVTAVASASFRIEPGEVFGLLGPNRAGKTTLVKLLLSLTRPSAGRIYRFGQPVSVRRTLARIGYMHERQAFPVYWDAVGLLSYYGAMTLLPEPEVRRRIPEVLRRVELTDRANEPIAHFSKGMLQRLALAQALMNDPDLLVLDEPTEGLDLYGRRLLRQVMEGQRQRGKSVLLVSHVLAEVERCCDRVAVLVGGRLVHSGALPSLIADNGEGPRTLETVLGELYQTERDRSRVTSGSPA